MSSVCRLFFTIKQACRMKRAMMRENPYTDVVLTPRLTSLAEQNPYAEVYVDHRTFPRHYVSTVPRTVPPGQFEVPFNIQAIRPGYSPRTPCAARSLDDGYEVPV